MCGGGTTRIQHDALNYLTGQCGSNGKTIYLQYRKLVQAMYGTPFDPKYPKLKLHSKNKKIITFKPTSKETMKVLSRTNFVRGIQKDLSIFSNVLMDNYAFKVHLVSPWSCFPKKQMQGL